MPGTHRRTTKHIKSSKEQSPPEGSTILNIGKDSSFLWIHGKFFWVSYCWYDIWPWGRRKGYKADKQVKPRGKANDEGVAGLGAKFTGSTHTVIGLSALLMSLIVERGQVPTRHSVDTHVAADFLCVLCSECPKTSFWKSLWAVSHPASCPYTAWSLPACTHPVFTVVVVFFPPGGVSRAPQNYKCLESVTLTWRKVGGCTYLCVSTVCWGETSVQFGK